MYQIILHEIQNVLFANLVTVIVYLKAYANHMKRVRVTTFISLQCNNFHKCIAVFFTG